MNTGASTPRVMPSKRDLGRASEKRRKSSLAWLKPGVLVGSLIPLLDLLVRARYGGLGANPVSEALNRLGLLALIFLIASLACTPLKNLGWATPMRLRRMLGLLAFSYASLHFAVYLLLDRLGATSTLREDLSERPFISVGFLAWLLLVPLAATSTAGMIKRLGAARWRMLHRLAYAAAGLGVLHFVWRVKRDDTEPILYGLVLLTLLTMRFKSKR
jgi:sulfoxide reductase heme-binding subunit YedZ